MHRQDTRDHSCVHGERAGASGEGSAGRLKIAPLQCVTHQKTTFPSRFSGWPLTCRQSPPRNRLIRKHSRPAGRFAKVQLWARLPGATATFRTKIDRSE